MVLNAWRHGQYSWFPPAPAAVPAVGLHAEEAEPEVCEEMEVEEEHEDKESENADSTDAE
jgi:hypothetical protein